VLKSEKEMQLVDDRAAHTAEDGGSGWPRFVELNGVDISKVLVNFQIIG
jgi:hypothetical protein